MRVCLAVPYFRPELGAASVRAESLVQALEAAGHEVTVVTPRPSYFLPASPLEKTAGSSTIDSKARSRRAPVRLRRGDEGPAKRLLFETIASGAAFPILAEEIRRADLVYTSSPPVPYSLAAAVAGRTTGTPVVVEVRDMWPEIVVATLTPERRSAPAIAALTGIGGLLADALYSLARRLVTVTGQDSEALRRKGIDASKILFAPNGADEMAISMGMRRGSRAPDGTGRFKIAYAGRLGPAQRVSTLVEAASLVERPLELTIVGSGPESSSLRCRARALPRHRISILQPMPRERVLELLLHQDAVYVPLASSSVAGSVPSKLFEALALGVPVILAAAGECRRIGEESGGCVIAEPGSASSIAEAIEALAADREAAFGSGIDGRRMVVEKHRREKIMAALVIKLEEVVAEVGRCNTSDA